MMLACAAMAALVVSGADPWDLPSGTAGAGSLNGIVRFYSAAAGVPPALCDAPSGSAMYRCVHGVAAVLDGRSVRQLAACGKVRQPDTPPVDGGNDLAMLWNVAVCGAGQEGHAVTISQAANGGLWAIAAGKTGANEERDAQLLRTDEAEAIFAEWPTYEGGFDAPPVGAPVVAEMPRPYIGSSWMLDKAGLSERFLRGRAATIDGMDRLLRLEKMHLRLPSGYSVKSPAGLLVWVDAGDKGPPPECVFEACDAANIVAVGIDNCGNTRPIANRYQLVLDAVATATRKCHIDKRRVYISGVSGGGRVSSIMAACFPDVFAGAVPIVGLSSYEVVAIPGRGQVPPAYAKPTERLAAILRRHRIAAITGGKDFNQGEIQAAATALRADGLQVKTFETVELGHELPKAGLFTKAITWVDEPYQKVRRAEVEQAERAMRSALAKIGDRTLLNESDRAALMRVTEVGPWTSAAWEAVGRLDGAGRGNGK